MKFGRLFPFALAVLVFAGRALSATASDSLAENYAKWQAHRPARYAFTYSIGCYCILPSWRVEVNGDTVVRVTNRDPELNASPEPDLRYYSVDSIFARIQTALDAHPDKAEIRYNASLGYPEMASFDPSTMARDDEYTIELTNFEEATVAARIPPSSPAGSFRMGPARDLAGRAVLRFGAGPVFNLPRR